MITETNVIGFLAAMGDPNATMASENRLSEKKSAYFTDAFMPEIGSGKTLILTKISTAEAGSGDVKIGSGANLHIEAQNEKIDLNVSVPFDTIEANIPRESEEEPLVTVYIEYYEYTFPVAS